MAEGRQSEAQLRYSAQSPIKTKINNTEAILTELSIC